MKKKICEYIMFVLCAAQIIGIASLFDVGDSYWYLLLFIPTLFMGWYLDTFCHIFGGQEEEEE